MGIYPSYAVLRLRWYARASGQALLRHWQWLLIAALLVPGLPIVPLLSVPAPLLLAIVSPDIAWPLHLAGFAALLLLSALWVLPQRRNLLGGDLAVYAGTLPTSPLAAGLVDLTVLLAADLLPLLFFAVALTRANAWGAIGLIALFAVLLTVQLWVLRHYRSPLRMARMRATSSRGLNGFGT